MVRTDYQFNAAAGTVTFADEVVLSKLGIIANITDGVIIYNSMDGLKTGTLVNKTLTLKYNTATMSNTDILQVFYSTVDAPDSDDYTELLSDILTELRVITSILNEGLNTKEDIDALREDEESDQE